MQIPVPLIIGWTPSPPVIIVVGSLLIVLMVILFISLISRKKQLRKKGHLTELDEKVSETQQKELEWYREKRFLMERQAREKHNRIADLIDANSPEKSHKMTHSASQLFLLAESIREERQHLGTDISKLTMIDRRLRDLGKDCIMQTGKGAKAEEWLSEMTRCRQMIQSNLEDMRKSQTSLRSVLSDVVKLEEKALKNQISAVEMPMATALLERCKRKLIELPDGLRTVAKSTGERAQALFKESAAYIPEENLHSVWKQQLDLDLFSSKHRPGGRSDLLAAAQSAIGSFRIASGKDDEKVSVDEESNSTIDDQVSETEVEVEQKPPMESADDSTAKVSDELKQDNATASIKDPWARLSAEPETRIDLDTDSGVLEIEPMEIKDEVRVEPANTEFGKSSPQKKSFSSFWDEDDDYEKEEAPLPTLKKVDVDKKVVVEVEEKVVEVEEKVAEIEGKMAEIEEKVADDQERSDNRSFFFGKKKSSNKKHDKAKNEEPKKPADPDSGYQFKGKSSAKNIASAAAAATAAIGVAKSAKGRDNEQGYQFKSGASSGGDKAPETTEAKPLEVEVEEKSKSTKSKDSMWSQPLDFGLDKQVEKPVEEKGKGKKPFSFNPFTSIDSKADKSKESSLVERQEDDARGDTSKLVIFRSNDPEIWNTTCERSDNQYSISVSEITGDANWLGIKRVDTGEEVFSEVSLPELKLSGDGKAVGFNGSNEYFYGARHLGFFSEQCATEVETRFTYGGWGFGHLATADGDDDNPQQICGWNGHRIPDGTTFEFTLYETRPEWAKEEDVIV